MRALVTVTAAVLLLAAVAAGQPAPVKPVEVETVIESPHRYPEGEVLEFPVEIPDARSLRVHFQRVDVETDFDFVEIVDGAGRVVERFTGDRRDFWSKPVAGDRLVIRLRADESMSFWGFRVDRLEVTRAPQAPPRRGPREQPEVVRVARLEIVPGAMRVLPGRPARLEVRGYDASGAIVPPADVDVYWNVFGDGAVLRGRRPGLFVYQAPEEIRRETVVRLRGYHARRPDVHAEARVTIRPRPNVGSLAVVPGRGDVDAGGHVDLRIQGRAPRGNALTDLADWPIRVWLEGPGRLEPLRGRGLYRYVAPAALDADAKVVIRSALVELPAIGGSTTLLVRPAVRLVGLRIVPSRSLLAPGEPVEFRVEGIGDRGDRRPSMKGVEVTLTIRRPKGRRGLFPPGKADRVWTWTAPKLIDGMTARYVVTASVAGRTDIRGELDFIVALPITAIEVAPKRTTIRAGGSVDLRVTGRTSQPDHRIIVPANRLTVRLDGPGLLRRGDGRGDYAYVAPEKLDRETRVTVTAELAGRRGITGSTILVVRPRVRLAAIDVAASRSTLRPGEEIAVRVTPRPHRRGLRFDPDEVRIEPDVARGTLRKTAPGAYVYRAPSDAEGRREVLLRFRGEADGKAVGEARLLVERPGTPADAPIDTDHLFVMTEWRIEKGFGPGWEAQPIPKDDIYETPVKDAAFRGRILRTDVRDLRIELVRKGSDEVKTYTTEDENLSLKRTGEGHWQFKFKKNFTHETRYLVRVLVTTTSGAVYREAFRVKRR